MSADNSPKYVIPLKYRDYYYYYYYLTEQHRSAPNLTFSISQTLFSMKN